jgi:hypothetical protein
VIARRAATHRATESRKLPGTYKIAIGIDNALILSILRRGKQLQLWDSNVHRFATQGYQQLQVPVEYGN